MSRRESCHSSKRKHFESPVSPNGTVDLITADLRVFFPPNATYLDVRTVLDDAYFEVLDKLYERG